MNLYFSWLSWFSCSFSRIYEFIGFLGRLFVFGRLFVLKIEENEYMYMQIFLPAFLIPGVLGDCLCHFRIQIKFDFLANVTL